MSDKKEMLDIPQHLRRGNVVDEVQVIVLITKLEAAIEELQTEVHDLECMKGDLLVIAKEQEQAHINANLKVAELQGVIEKLREVVPKLVEVAEGGISTTSAGEG